MSATQAVGGSAICAFRAALGAILGLVSGWRDRPRADAFFFSRTAGTRPQQGDLADAPLPQLGRHWFGRGLGVAHREAHQHRPAAGGQLALRRGGDPGGVAQQRRAAADLPVPLAHGAAARPGDRPGEPRLDRGQERRELNDVAVFEEARVGGRTVDRRACSARPSGAGRPPAGTRSTWPGRMYRTRRHAGGRAHGGLCAIRSRGRQGATSRSASLPRGVLPSG